MKRGRKRRAVEGDVVTDEVENETGGQQAVQMNEIKKRLCELIKMRQSLRTSGAKSYPAAKSHSQDVNSACKAKVSSPVIHQPDEPQVPEGVMAQTQQDQPQLNSFVTNKPSQPQVWSVVNNQSGQPQVYSVVNNQSGQPQVYSVVNNQPGQPQLYSVVNNQPGQPQVYSAVNNEPGQPLVYSVVNNEPGQPQVHSVVYQPGQPLMHSVVNNEPGQPQVYPIVPGEAQVCSIVDNQYPEGRVKPVIKVETIETANQPQIFPVVKGTKVVDNPGEEFHVKFDLGGIDISQVSLGEIPSKAGEGSLRSADINTECADVLADHHLIASEAKSRQACVETLGTCSDVFKTECDDNVAPVQTDRETFSTTVVIKTEYADSQMCTGVVPVQAVRETLGPTVVIREEYADSEACPGVVPVHTEREILSTTVIIKTECADSLADNQVCTQVKMEPIDHPGQVDCSRWAEGGTHQRVTAQSQECGSDPLTQRSLHPATQEEEGPLIITELFAHASASEVGSRGRAPGDSVTSCACTAPPGGELDSSASGLGIVRSAGGAVTVPCEEVYKSAKYQPLVKLERLPLSASDVVMLSQLPDKHVKWSYVSCQTLGGTNPSYLVSRDPKSPRSSPRLLSPKDTPQRKPVLVSCSDTVNLSQPAAKHDKLVSASGNLSSDVVQGQTLFGTGGSYVCPVIRNLASPGLASSPIWCNGLPLSKLVLVSSIADKPVSGNSTPSRELFGAKHGCQANRTPKSQRPTSPDSFKNPPLRKIQPKPGLDPPLRKIQPKPGLVFVPVQSLNENTSVFRIAGDPVEDPGNQHNTRKRRAPMKLKRICHVCDKKFPSKSSLEMHMARHRGEKKTCEVCQKMVSASYLYRHLKLHNNPSAFKPYLCSLCGFRCPSRSAHKQHMFKHTGERERCPVCQKSIATGYFKEHMKTHTNPKKKLYHCTLCEKAFPLIGKLNRHMLCHKGVRETCPICEKSFSAEYLRRHLGKHRSVAREMPYGCSVCGRQFRAEAPYRRHMVTQHGEGAQ